MKINIQLMKKKINITENQQSQVPVPWKKKLIKLITSWQTSSRKKKKHKLPISEIKKKIPQHSQKTLKK